MTLIEIAAFMVLLGTGQMVSIFAQDVTHLTSIQAGMVLLPGAALMQLRRQLLVVYMMNLDPSSWSLAERF